MEAYPNSNHDSLRIIIRDKGQVQGEVYPVMSSVTGHSVAAQSAVGLHLEDNAETNVTTTVGQWPSNSYKNAGNFSGESCCHAQRKLPEPMFEARQSCCYKQSIPPENANAGLSAGLVADPGLASNQNGNQRSDSSVAVSICPLPVSAGGTGNDELPFHQQGIDTLLSVENGVVSPGVLDHTEAKTVQHDEQDCSQFEGAVGQGTEVPKVKVKGDVDTEQSEP